MMLRNVFLASAVGVLLAASQPALSLAQEKTLRVGMLYDLNLIDPYAQTDYLPRYLGFMAYDPASEASS